MNLHRTRKIIIGIGLAGWLLCLSWAVLLGGCSWFGGSGDYVTNISSPQPEVASKAMNKAAKEKSPLAIAPLVKRLYDEDPAMRLSAIKALHRITGEDMGYRSYEPQVKRMAAIQRWEAYLVQEGLQNEQEEHEQL